MATEKKTRFNNVIERDNNESKTNEKNPITYSMGFNGTETLVNQPIPFEPFGKTTRITSAELSSRIYAMFSQTFHELRGCNILAVPTPPGFIVELFFERNNEPLPEGKIMNLESLIDTANNDSKNMYYRQQVVQNRKKGKIYTLNNETKLLLSKFMYGGELANAPDNNKVWANALSEVHESASNDIYYRGYNTDHVLLRVTNLNIRIILQALYGDEMIFKTVATEDGDINYRSKANYEPKFIKSLPDGSFIMNIEQFDKGKVEDIFMKENPIQQQYLGGIRMYS